MTGKYQHTIDAKGRLAIPARLRDELGDMFYVTIGIGAFLSVYSLERWKEFEDRCAALPMMDQRRMSPIFANAVRCELDSQGRILLPQELRDYAGLVKDVKVVGLPGHAEIWDNEAYIKQELPMMTPEYLSGVMSELGF